MLWQRSMTEYSVVPRGLEKLPKTGLNDAGRGDRTTACEASGPQSNKADEGTDPGTTIAALNTSDLQNVSVVDH